MLMDLGLLPRDVLSYNLIDWKQCVIYGDDYAGGVNFILWYIELGNTGSPVLKLLLDSETGEIYGVRLNCDNIIGNATEDIKGYNTNLMEFLGIEELNLDFWWTFAYWFGGLDTGLLNIVSLYGIDMKSLYDQDIAAELDAYLNEDVYLYGKEENVDVQAILENVEWQIEEDGNRWAFRFPYGEQSLFFCLEMDGQTGVLYLKDKFYLGIDVTLGFPEIYELIDAFME